MAKRRQDEQASKFGGLTASELPAPRRRILEALWECGEASISQLAERLGLSVSAVRQQTQLLCDAELVEAHRALIVHSGRPLAIFKIAPRATALLTTPGSALLDVLGAVLSAPGPSANAFGRTMASRWAETLCSSDADLELAEQLIRAADRLNASGYRATSSDDLLPLLVLDITYCPHEAVAARYPALCEVECQALAAAFPKMEVKRVAHRPSGDASCAYRLRPATEA